MSSTSRAASVAGVLLGVSTMVVGGVVVVANRSSNADASPPAVSSTPVAGTPSASSSPTKSGSKDPTTSLPVEVRLPSGSTGPVDATYADPTTGALELPDNGTQLVWWAWGASPGEKSGTVLIAGHKDFREPDGKVGIGTFNQLFDVNLGDRIDVSTTADTTVAYAVRKKEALNKSGLPDSLFSRKGKAQLVLLTCGGPYDHQKRAYRDNFLVYADPV